MIQIIAIYSLSNTQLRPLGDPDLGDSRLSQSHHSGPPGTTGDTLERLSGVPLPVSTLPGVSVP